MDVNFARRARDELEAGGLDVGYHESDAAHHIDPAHVPAAVEFVAETLAPGSAFASAVKGGSGRR